MKKLTLLILGIILLTSVFCVQADLYDYRLLHNFSDVPGELKIPYGAIALAGSRLYGTTMWGGSNIMDGAIYSLNTAGSDFQIVYEFNDLFQIGHQPHSGLISYNDHLFGTTRSGGAAFLGTIYTVDPISHAVTLVYAFGSTPNDGAVPAGTLTEKYGVLYGTTSAGGQNDSGIIFSIHPDGSHYAILHSFNVISGDGFDPSLGKLAIDNTRIYGTTCKGGLHSKGVLYSVNHDGSDYRVLHAFADQPGNVGEASMCPVLDGSSIFGLSDNGGEYNEGALYRINTDGSNFSIIHSFGADLSNGGNPYSTLVDDGSCLYGTTMYGGTNVLGTLFSFNKSSHDFSVIHHFGGTNDGGYPMASQLLLNDNILYGTTILSSGFNLAGTVYALSVGNAILPQAQDYVASTVERKAPYGPLNPAQIDISGDSPAMPPSLLVYSYTQPAHGTAHYDDTTGIFTYLPQRLFNGVDRFDYTAYDGSIGTIMVYVKPVAKRGNFDGDGAADPAVFCSTMGEWFISQSKAGTARHEAYGWDGTIPVCADYDGDGIIDIAVYYPSANQWYASFSDNSMQSIDGMVWGSSIDDIPVPADYDGDGQADLAGYNPSTGVWTIRRSTTMMPWIITLGSAGAIPVPADYDGDGKADPAVYNAVMGEWTIFQNPPLPTRSVTWGWADAVPVPADFDGDSITDIAVFWPATGNWYIQQSHDLTMRTQNWGWAATTPIPADYDNDGLDDLAVYHPASGDWYIYQSKTGTARIINWGWSDAIPAF